MATKKKRAAGNYLTADNYDQEEDPQEAGVFSPANEEILSSRIIRKAKRRGTGPSQEESESDETKKNPFAGFAGFGKTPTTNLTFGAKPISIPSTNIITASSFSLQKNNTSNDSSTMSTFWKNNNESVKEDFFANRKNPEKLTEQFDNRKDFENKNTNSHMNGTTKEKEKTINDDDTYYQQLSELNVGVLDWIKTHVDDNPCIDLQPVFRDYEKHMKAIRTKFEAKKQTVFSTANGSSNLNILKTPVISNTLKAGSVSATGNTPSLFSSLKSSTPISSASALGDAKTSNTLFNTQSPFSFKPPTKNPETVKEENPDEPSDEVKEPERKLIVEKDAFHQIRCKLFFKKGSEWKELGIGMLYLKPSGSDNKIQLLIRMETSTGKVLLNISISNDSIVSRSGKNNVMVVSIPNPPVYTKESEGDNTLPCTYLVRVKGSTEADALFGKLKFKEDGD